MSKLPIGIQSFKKIREDGYVYVDKTQYIQNLLASGSVYFLSRPRRFGKSLFLSTLEAYFRGQKDLFCGLAIETYEQQKPEKEQWIEYPVMKFSLSGGSYSTDEGMERMLALVLEEFEQEYGIPHFHVQSLRADLPVWLKYCIEQCSRITAKPIAFLVDEYDKPLLENLSVNLEQEERNRTLFKGFFSVLKDEDAYLKFVFFTGVTKFSKVSIFSDLNQLRDISLLPAYGTICGITEHELDDYFQEELIAMAAAQELTAAGCREKLAKVYDGYHFSENSPGVYNPFSLLNALSDQRFGRYWFETGTPTFLIQKLRRSGLAVQEFSHGVQVTEDRITSFHAEDDDVIPLYYQTGYLTITGYDREFQEYTLSYPNDEVKYGYLNSLIPAVGSSNGMQNSVFSASRMVRCLQDNDLEPFMTMLMALLASIPYHEGKAPSNEQEWQNVIYAIFTVLGQYVRTEVHSSGGRSDCIAENDSYIYIFEFKQDKTAEEALRQIDDKGYALPYSAGGKKIVKIGANFSNKKRTLDEWN